MLDFLKASYDNEIEEYDFIYKDYAKIVEEEGFILISKTFNSIAEIEKVHADRFMRIYEKLKTGNLFKKDKKVKWFCTNCGHIHEGEEAQEMCEVCNHPRGYHMLFEEFFRN